MKCKSSRILAIGLTFLAVVCLVCQTAYCQGKGGGKGGNGGGGGESNSAPVSYRVCWIENIWGDGWGLDANDINDSGTVVGHAEGPNGLSRAFMWTPAVSTEDLNDLEGVRLNSPSGTFWSEAGWVAITAEGVNQWNEVVGTAWHPDEGERVYVLRFPAGLDPFFQLLPRLGPGENRGEAINDDGVVVGKYYDGQERTAIVYTPWTDVPYEPVELPIALYSADINNNGVFVEFTGTLNNPQAHRVTPVYHDEDGDGVPDWYSYNDATLESDVDRIRNYRGINDSGMICGERNAAGKGKNQIIGGPILIDESGTEHLLASGNPFYDFSGDINNAGDVCFVERVFLYDPTDLEGLPGHVFDLDQLVVGDIQDIEVWLASEVWPRGISNSTPAGLAPDSRDATSYGMICGDVSTGGRAFVLIPETPLLP